MRALPAEVDAVTNINIKLQRIFITSAIVASDFGDVLIVTSEARLYLRTRFVFRNEVGHCVPPYKSMFASIASKSQSENFDVTAVGKIPTRRHASLFHASRK